MLFGESCDRRSNGHGPRIPPSLAVTTANYDECSPGTEVFNPNDTTATPDGTDYIFFSVQGAISGHYLHCCRVALVRMPIRARSTVVYLRIAAFRSGLIADQLSTASLYGIRAGRAESSSITSRPTGQASSVYFTPLGSAADVGTGTGGDPCATYRLRGEGHANRLELNLNPNDSRGGRAVRSVLGNQAGRGARPLRF